MINNGIRWWNITLDVTDDCYFRTWQSWMPGSMPVAKSNWTYSVTFATDIECGIQILWTVNRRAIFKWKIVRPGAEVYFFLNNFSLGNGSVIRALKNLNATFNVSSKSNWVLLLIHSKSLHLQKNAFLQSEINTNIEEIFNENLTRMLTPTVIKFRFKISSEYYTGLKIHWL